MQGWSIHPPCLQRSGPTRSGCSFDDYSRTQCRTEPCANAAKRVVLRAGRGCSSKLAVPIGKTRGKAPLAGRGETAGHVQRGQQRADRPLADGAFDSQRNRRVDANAQRNPAPRRATRFHEVVTPAIQAPEDSRITLRDPDTQVPGRTSDMGVHERAARPGPSIRGARRAHVRSRPRRLLPRARPRLPGRLSARGLVVTLFAVMSADNLLITLAGLAACAARQPRARMVGHGGTFKAYRPMVDRGLPGMRRCWLPPGTPDA